MENDEILKNAKEVWDCLDLIDLSKDILEGENLLIRRTKIPQYVILANGCYVWNMAYKTNEDNIMVYINKIIIKYKAYIDLNNLVVRLRKNKNYNNEENIPNNIEPYIALLMKLMQAKLMKKTIEEIFE